MSIMPIDTTSELAVSDYLTQCRNWLATCVEMTGPEQIAAAKAEIATAAEATKQLGLSKEIQLDAREMVRRAEYALGKALRKGQAEGTIAPHGGTNGFNKQEVAGSPTSLPRPLDFGSRSEIYGTQSAHGSSPGALALADEIPDAADFNAAITEAKDEGNLSRANVARKAREKSGRTTPQPEPASASDDASLALLNDIRGPWTRGITKSARLMTPKARAHLIDALENALTQIRNIR